MQTGIRLFIGERDVSELVVECNTTQDIAAPSTLDVTLQCQGAALASVYLGGGVTLEFENQGVFHPYFNGFVVHAHLDQSLYHIRCIDGMRLFQEVRVGSVPGPGIQPSELIFYLLAPIDPEHVLPENISLEAGKSLADQTWVFARRRYVFIAPLPFCRLETDEVQFGRARIYRLDGKGGIEDQNIASSLPNDPPSEWLPEVPRIRFFVMAEGFLDAFERGRARLRQFFDILSFGANLTTPCFTMGADFQYLKFDRDSLLAGVEEPVWVYARDTIRPDRYWLRWYQPHRSGDPFSLSADDSVFAVHPLFAPLLNMEPEDLPSGARAILNAMHALRESRQAQNPMDSLVHLFNCVEFLVSGQPSSLLFDKVERAALVRAAVQATERIYAEHSVVERKRRTDRIRNVLNDQLNSPSLRTKWLRFCESYGIEVSKEENDILWETLRPQRNHQQHGRTASTDRANLNRASNILERAMLRALTSTRTGQ